MSQARPDGAVGERAGPAGAGTAAATDGPQAVEVWQRANVGLGQEIGRAHV